MCLATVKNNFSLYRWRSSLLYAFKNSDFLFFWYCQFWRDQKSQFETKKSVKMFFAMKILSIYQPTLKKHEQSFSFVTVFKCFPFRHCPFLLDQISQFEKKRFSKIFFAMRIFNGNRKGFVLFDLKVLGFFWFCCCQFWRDVHRHGFTTIDFQKQKRMFVVEILFMYLSTVKEFFQTALTTGFFFLYHIIFDFFPPNSACFG